MKKIIPFLCVLLTVTLLSSFELSNISNKRRAIALQKQDTVELLKNNIIARKAEFIGQPLNKLLAELPFKVKCYSRKVNHIRVHEPATTITLYFIDSRKVLDYSFAGKEYAHLTVEFEHPIDRDTPEIKIGQSGNGDWGINEIAYYGGRTVKEISGLQRMKKQ